MRSRTEAQAAPAVPVDPRGPDRPEALRLTVQRFLDLGLALMAGAGALSAVWFIVSTVCGLAIVSFATGSMSPAYPSGSLALSAPVTLADVRIGDVVTVDRDGRLPITHRVTRVSLAPDGSTAELWLRGDANRFGDPQPYSVGASDVRRVIAPIPFGRTIVEVAASPLGLGTVAMLVTGGIFWAIWPRSRYAG